LPSPRLRWTEAKASVIGAPDGNIIATIITSQVTRKRAALIMAMPPMPIAPAWSMVISHAAAAHATRAATIAVASGLGSGATCCTARMSGRPVEGRRKRALAAVVELHSKCLDARLGRPRDGQRRIRGMEDAYEFRRLFETFGRVVLDINRDVAADLDVVLVPAVVVLDGMLFDAEHLADERRQSRHRAAHLA